MTKLQLITLRCVKKLIENQSFPLPTIACYLPDGSPNKEMVIAEDARNTERWKNGTDSRHEAMALLDALLEEDDE